MLAVSVESSHRELAREDVSLGEGPGAGSRNTPRDMSVVLSLLLM